MAWSEQKVLKWNLTASLGEQFKEREPIVMPLHLMATFFLPMPRQACPTKAEGKGHYQKPTLSELVAGLLDLVDGIVLKPECLVVSFNCKKVYDSIPRVEFEFTRIE